MTLDAQDWVWKHSQSKGNTRIALLYVADQVRTLACEVRVGHRELMEALNTASKSTAEEAVKKAVALRELEVVEEGTGRRPTLYRLPKAAGYVRTTPSSAPVSGAQETASAPKTGAQPDDQAPRSAPKTGAQENRSAPVFGRSAPETGAPTHTHKQASQQEGQPRFDDYGIPAPARPLVDAMTHAGLGYIRWPFKGDQWFPVLSLIHKCGIEAMVAHAVKAASRTNVESVKYFMHGWGELPPLPKGPPPPRDSPDKRRQMPPWCRDPDCDERTRFRDAEADNGLRYSAPCPNCHPSRKDAA